MSGSYTGLVLKFNKSVHSHPYPYYISPPTTHKNIFTPRICLIFPPTQTSVEEAPSNNVVISHPTLGMTHPVKMGMHIKPVERTTNRHDHDDDALEADSSPVADHEVEEVLGGYKILTVEEGGITDQANLR